MSAIPSGRASFKKKDGILTISPDQTRVTWTPGTGTGPPTVSLALENITNLQQTPPTSPKVILKIIEKAPGAAEPTNYMFTFTSTEARTEADAVKDVLSRLLQEVRAGDPSLPKAAASTGIPTANGIHNKSGSGSGSMTFASSANSKPAAARWFDESQLKSDIGLQQSLMKADRNLNQTYMEARATKPDSISDAAFNAQFWSTRTNLLRAHAIEMNQKRGAYNVLSTIKPRTEGEELRLNISVEQVQLIFSQHPLIKRLYNENVPKISESEFWSRFFLSKLSRTLRGDKVQDEKKEGIVRDPLFDNHDESENTLAFQSKIMSQSVPHIIDVEGNEENTGGFKSGNQKDIEMRPRQNVLIVKTLNSLSEKIMCGVAPSDSTELNEPDNTTFQQLALRDLRGDAEEQRVILNVKEQNRFFSNNEQIRSGNAVIFAKQRPSHVLLEVQTDMELLVADKTTGINLHEAIGIIDKSDSDDDVPQNLHVGSRVSRKAAEHDVMEGVKRRRVEKYGTGSAATEVMGLPADIAERCQLTHATTVEFLHQFWTAFLSGDPDRAAELQYLVESLRRSEERISVVATEAEAARRQIIEIKTAEIKAKYKNTGVKDRSWHPRQVKGGQKAVMQMMKPILDALKKAQADYGKALAEQGLQQTTEG